MTALSDRDLAEIQTFVDRSVTELASQGLTVETDPDLRAWKAHMEAVSTPVAATHDPDLNNLDASNSFWVKLLTPDGKIAACGVYRVIETDSFVYEVASHRLFGDRAPIVNHYEIDVCTDREMLDIRGRVGLGGGIWTADDYRRRGLGGLISRYLRTLSVRWYSTDFHTGFVQHAERSDKLGLEVYGFPHAALLIRGAHPGYSGDDHDTVLVWMRQDEVVSYISLENKIAAAEGRDGETRLTA